MSRVGQKKKTGKCFLAVAGALAVAMLLGWTLRPHDGPPSTAEVLPIADELPTSLEEYRTKLNLPDFGRNSVDYSKQFATWVQDSPIKKGKQQLLESVGLRAENRGVVTGIIDLATVYSAVAKKRVYFARSRGWFEQYATNEMAYDDSATMSQDLSLRIMESMLRSNGIFLFPLNKTSVVMLAGQDLRTLGHDLPDQTHEE